MRQELYAMINRWFDKGVAGFRIDSITFIKKIVTILVCHQMEQMG